MAKIFEYKLCHEKDLENNSMKECEVDLGGDGDSSNKYKVLLVKSDNQFQCLPTKCTHYNAPLANGILYKGRLRCFAHGAAFNVLTGDIEDYPGPDCLPKYKVSVDKTTGFVILHVTQQELEITKRLRTSQQKPGIAMPILKSLPRCLIIGSGAAGLLCVDTFREAGWSSNVTMITSDTYPPYDRPKLSKSPDLPFDKIGLRDVAFFQENNINFHMNQFVETIDFEARVAVCKDGRTFAYDRLVIATGLRANSGSQEANFNLKGVFTIRSLQDTQKLVKYFDEIKAEADAENRKLNVVVTGGSFIAMEVVCFFASKANALVMSRSRPYETAFGGLASEKIQSLHESKGIKFYINKKFNVNEFCENKERPGRLEYLKLQDGSKWHCDICIQAIGGSPSTSFLKNSSVKLTLDNYVFVNRNMETNLKHVYAAGDIAQFPRACMPGFEFTLSKHNQKLDHVNIAHWGVASSHGRCAALSILNSNTESQPSDKLSPDSTYKGVLKIVPFFWSSQHGKNLRFAGYNHHYDVIIFHEDKKGENEFKFAAFYLLSNIVVAVCSLDWDPVCALFAEAMYNGKQVRREHVERDPLEIKNLLVT